VEPDGQLTHIPPSSSSCAWLIKSTRSGQFWKTEEFGLNTYCVQQILVVAGLTLLDSHPLTM
jgi:hypothetical protein